MQHECMVATPCGGLVVPVACMVPPDTAVAVQQQLTQAPQRVFAPLNFGAVDVVAADVKAAGGREQALSAAVAVAAAAATAMPCVPEHEPAAQDLLLTSRSLASPKALTSQASLTFSLALPRMPGNDAEQQQAAVVEALLHALPPGSAASVRHIAELPSGEVLIIAAAEVPAEAADAACELEQALQQAPQTVFKPAAFGGVRLMALQRRAAEALAAGQQVLAFSLTLPNMHSSAAFKEDKEEALVAALQAAMPPGSAVGIRSTATTPHGLLVSVVVELPHHAAPTQAAEMAAQLQEAPGSVLPPETFGPVSVTTANVDAAGSAAAAADAAAATAAAMRLAGEGLEAKSGHAVAFTVALPDVRNPGVFQGNKEAALVSAVGSALPEGSAVKVSTLMPGARSLLVTVAAELPRSSSTAAEQAAYVAHVLHHAPQQLLSPAEFGDVQLVALEAAAPPAPAAVAELAGDGSMVQEFTAREQAMQARLAEASPAAPVYEPLAFTLALPALPVASLEDSSQQKCLLAAMCEALPAGAAVAIDSISATLNGGTIVSVTAEMPATNIAALQDTLEQCISQTVAPTFGPAVMDPFADEDKPDVYQADESTATAVARATEDGRAGMALTLALPVGCSQDEVAASLREAVPGEAGRAGCGLLRCLPGPHPRATPDPALPRCLPAQALLLMLCLPSLPPTALCWSPCQRCCPQLRKRVRQRSACCLSCHLRRSRCCLRRLAPCACWPASRRRPSLCHCPLPCRWLTRAQTRARCWPACRRPCLRAQR